jgi:hypothetical protein
VSLCLTPEEIAELTGKTQPAAQLRHLRKMGVRAYRRDNGKGSVCVAREWLAGRSTATAQSKPTLKSDRSREQTAEA